jgi:SpoVK/Ycf46/Vps4 family AAA+-type ATPase
MVNSNKTYIKKFLKKNTLLQSKLEKFLIWREQNSYITTASKPNSKTKAFQKLTLSDLKKNPTKFSLKNREFQRSGFGNPVSIGRFFPYKKPFMQFWLFPLLGGCFLSYLTLEAKNTTHEPYGFRFNAGSIPHQNTGSAFWCDPEAKAFIGNVPSSKNGNKFSKSTGEAFEKLCLFYLNLTDNFSNSETFKTLPDSKTLREPSTFESSSFDWTWHRLETESLENSPSGLNQKRRPLGEKLQTSNQIEEVSNLLHSKSRNSKNALNFASPTLSYLHANELFDKWVTAQTANSTSDQKIPNFDGLKAMDSFVSEEFGRKNFSISQFADLTNKQIVNQKTLKNQFEEITFQINETLAQPQLEKIQTKNLEISMNDWKNNSTKYFLKLYVQNTLEGKKAFAPFSSEIKNRKRKLANLNSIHDLNLFKNHIKQSLLVYLNQPSIPVMSTIEKIQTLQNQLKTFDQGDVIHKTDGNSVTLNDLQDQLKKTLYELFLIQNWDEILINRTSKNILNKNPSQLLKIVQNNQRNFEPILESGFEKNQRSKNSRAFWSIRVAKTKAKAFLIEDIKLYQQMDRIFKKLKKSHPGIFTPAELKGSDKNPIILYQKPLTVAKISSQKKPLVKIEESFPNLNSSFSSLEMKPKETSFSSSNSSNSANYLGIFKTAFNPVDVKNPFSNFTHEVPVPTWKNSNKMYPLSTYSIDEEILEKSLLKDGKKFQIQPNRNTKSVTSMGHVEGSLNEKQLSASSVKTRKSWRKNRKAEKIFRAYTSIKAPSVSSNHRLKNQILKKQRDALFPILKRFKEKIQRRRSELFQNPSKNLLMKQLKLDLRNKENISGIPFGLNQNRSLLNNKQHLQKRDFRLQEKMNLMSAQMSSFLKENPSPQKSQVNKMPFFDLKSMDAKIFLKKCSSGQFLKTADFLGTNFSDLKRLEQKQSFQKKRRLKKLKLENRRRKKRKRFYPRPDFLRFQLYAKFLEKRHSLAIFEKSTLRSSFYSLKRKLYSPLKLQKANVRKFPSILNNPSFHEPDYYKISNETLTEFERLSWKSYWLRLNLKPYISKIQNHLKEMKKVETAKMHEKEFVIQTQKFQMPESFKNSASVYLNIQESLNQSALFDSDSALGPFFKQLSQNKEYDRLLQARINEEIKNVKSQLNLDGGQNPRSYKVGRQKFEISRPKTLFHGLAAFETNYLEPKIHNFSPTSLTYDPSIKPFGDLPTLRVLWACNKSHLFTSRDGNFAKSLWETYKQREQTKNNKTRKFISKLFKKSPFHRQNLDQMSKRKIEFARKKIQVFGGRIYGKNYHSYLRELKFRLHMHPELKDRFSSQSAEKHGSGDKRTAFAFDSAQKENLNFQPNSWFENQLTHPPQKRNVHFWWTTLKTNAFETKFPIFVSSPLVFSTFLDGLLENFPLTWTTTGSVPASLNLGAVLTKTSFWLCCCLFHVSLLFFFIRIPEIRSLIKFQILILSKVTNVYFVSLFSIYDILKTYQEKIQLLSRKFQKLDPRQPSELNFMKTHLQNRSYLNTFKKNSGLGLKANSLTKEAQMIEKEHSVSGQVFIETGLTFEWIHRWLGTRIHSDLSAKTQNDLVLLISSALSPYQSSYTVRIPESFSKEVTSKSSKLFRFQKTQKTNWLFPIFKVSQSNVNGSIKPTLEKASVSLLKSPGFDKSKIRWQKNASILSLWILSFTKLSFNIFYFCLNLASTLVFKSIDLIEAVILIFYKFLEKPAELMVAWIADFFLIEWTAEFTSYIPEAFDQKMWESLTKFSRSSRFLGVFPMGWFFQHVFLSSTEIFYRWILKPDMDLRMRRKKGMIFWDIWSEILIQAAEKYKMNLASLSTVKEEQELLMENLLQEKTFQWTSKQSVDSISQTKKPTLELSLNRLNPLLESLKNFPKNVEPFKFENSSDKLSKIQSVFKPVSPEMNSLIFETSSVQNFFDSKNAGSFNSEQSLADRWAVNQYLTVQGRDTDLFMDIHPPKSFQHLSFLKSYLPAQEILGSLVCDIYAGLFSHKVAKNILIVGAPGTAKSFFIQALAGETELKIVTDNSQRYAFVNGGVPVGMKLLRDVFDSLALHTPCLFLLEDIHIIGERRPMLMSDDENPKDQAFGSEQEEVHEKNKLIYQFSRHALSHYKKPYKGDFSLSIPTNHFSYDLFLGVEAPRRRSSDLTAKSQLPLSQIETNLEGGEASSKKNSSKEPSLLSSLQLSLEQFFVPPATSPFHVLLMKEQKRLKPRKIVKEMPWSGFSYDQFMLVSKTQYSVRVKVALLAETALTQLSVKLDMITDLLVIIDSVRSNRGFVVFATTHAPALLDPALRRPGRFDETIPLPLFPNLTSRFEILKTHLNSYSQTFDFFDYSLYTSQTQQNENQISESISKSLLLMLNTPNKRAFSNFSTHHLSQNPEFQDYSIYSISQAFQTSLNLKALLLEPRPFQKMLKHVQNSRGISSPIKPVSLKHDRLNYISLSYAQTGQFLVESLILKDYKTYARKFFMNSDFGVESAGTEESIFKTFYETKRDSKNTLLKLFAGKISEFFILAESPNSKSSLGLFESTSDFNTQKDSMTRATNQLMKFPTNPSQMTTFEHIQNSQNYWQSAVTFLEGLIQKRYIYQKNAIVSKMLFFEDHVGLREPPNPPNSSILMTSKKFENYKRTLRDFIQKPMATIQEKLQLHQKQRFLKVLYNVPVQKQFPNISTVQQDPKNFGQTRNLSPFHQAFQELGYLDPITLKPSSSSSFYKNRFLIRHRFSFLNQWWNGQLAEHTAESTYLSHVDWRSMFVESLGDILIDFPDAEQYYNPRSRRWFLQSRTWSYWFDFDKNRRTEILQHLIWQSFDEIFNLLNANREMFDYTAFRFLRDHQLREIDLIQTLVRFYKNS